MNLSELKEAAQSNFEGQDSQIMTLLSQDPIKLDQEQRKIFVSVKYMIAQSRTQTATYVKASQGIVKKYLGNPAIAEILKNVA